MQIGIILCPKVPRYMVSQVTFSSRCLSWQRVLMFEWSGRTVDPETARLVRAQFFDVADIGSPALKIRLR
jgi:hypothetical protein